MATVLSPEKLEKLDGAIREILAKSFYGDYPRDKMVVRIIHGEEAARQGKVYIAQGWLTQEDFDESEDEPNFEMAGSPGPASVEDDSDPDDYYPDDDDYD